MFKATYLHRAKYMQGLEYSSSQPVLYLKLGHLQSHPGSRAHCQISRCPSYHNIKVRLSLYPTLLPHSSWCCSQKHFSVNILPLNVRISESLIPGRPNLGYMQRNLLLKFSCFLTCILCWIFDHKDHKDFIFLIYLQCNVRGMKVT